MEWSTRDHTMVNIGDADEVLASSIENLMLRNSFMSTRCSIFKIPNILYRHDERAYVPNAFSIGPLHHGKLHLKDTEKIKLHYLHGLIHRAPTKETSLKNFIKAIRKLEGEARESYAVPINFTVDEFVQMLVLDGCFIIELLRKIDGEVLSDKDDPIRNMSCMSQFLLHDLILLENQIPWLVLDCLFSMTMVPNSKSLTELAIKVVSYNLSRTTLPMVNANHGSKHLLDLLRNSLALPYEIETGNISGRWQLIPSATSLVEAGIKLKKRTSGSILDITFSNGVLEIPPLLIQETTNDTFRNLISFEQCYCRCTAKITSYAILLGNLINTTKDVNILQEHGIFDCWLNPGETIQLFSELYHDAGINEFYYLELCNQVNKYCQNNWPRWRAMYVRNHFNSPWAIISQVVGGIILVLTFLQTLYSIKK